MATIPLGNFGNVMPQAQPGRVLDIGAGQVAQAVNTLGQVGQQVAVKQLNEQQKIQDEKEEYFFNTQAAKYGAEYTDVVTDTKQKLATGEFDENSAKAYLRQQSDLLNQNYRQTLPQAKQEKFDYYSEKMFQDSQVSVRPLAFETERKKINADFSQVTEATLKLENREQGYALFKNTLDKNPVLTPEQRVEEEQQWQQRRDLTEGKGVLAELEGKSDVEGLQKVYDNVDSIFPHMKVETRDAYKGQIESAIDRINKANVVTEKQLLAEAKQLAGDFRTDAYTGYPISAERTDAVLSKVKGTEYEAQVKEDLTMNKLAQSFRKLSPLEQEREIKRRTSELENVPQEDGSLLQKQLSMFQSIANTTKTRSKDDPIGQIQSQTGKKLYTVTPEEMGTGNIDFKQAQITTQLLAEQKKNNGSGSLIQWNTSERQAFLNTYHDATPQKQKAMLLDLTKIAGSNRDAMKEYFTMLAGEQNALDYMGIAKLARMGVHVPKTNIQLADIALEGKHLINQRQDKLFAKQDAFNLQIQSEFGNSVGVGSNEHRAFQNIAYSVYVGLAKREGGIKIDDKGNPIIDKELAKRSFDIATGGTYKQPFGKNTNYVFMPYGFTQNSFEDHIEEHLRTKFRQETGFLPPGNSFLKEYAVRPVAGFPSWYQFIGNDGQPFKNPKTAKSYVMKIIN